MHVFYDYEKATPHAADYRNIARQLLTKCLGLLSAAPSVHGFF